MPCIWRPAPTARCNHLPRRAKLCEQWPNNLLEHGTNGPFDRPAGKQLCITGRAGHTWKTSWSLGYRLCCEPPPFLGMCPCASMRVCVCVRAKHGCSISLAHPQKASCGQWRMCCILVHAAKPIAGYLPLFSNRVLSHSRLSVLKKKRLRKPKPGGGSRGRMR